MPTPTDSPSRALAAVSATEKPTTTTTSITTVVPRTKRVKGPDARDSEMTAMASGGDRASMMVPVRMAAATVTDRSSSRRTTATTI
ncbi:hypothetical protein, partial [Streptomyces rhizosphaericus]|uniref:hypothetical protein n=1 Tax=Streptomyces rhizosphaericus TaxID=114699 RepID=UPI0031E2965B